MWNYVQSIISGIRHSRSAFVKFLIFTSCMKYFKVKEKMHIENWKLEKTDRKFRIYRIHPNVVHLKEWGGSPGGGVRTTGACDTSCLAFLMIRCDIIFFKIHTKYPIFTVPSLPNPCTNRQTKLICTFKRPLRIQNASSVGSNQFFYLQTNQQTVKHNWLWESGK